jgi:hypothetical protein
MIFRLCLFNLLIQFFSSSFQKFHLKFMVYQGFHLLPHDENLQQLVPLDHAVTLFYSTLSVFAIILNSQQKEKMDPHLGPIALLSRK